MKNKNIAQQVQDQIIKSKLDLGKVKVGQPKGFFSAEEDPTNFESGDNLRFAVRYFREIQGRCKNFAPMLSGLNRGSDFGWCSLSMNDAVARPEVIDAQANWLRTGGCTDGRYTPCSGYSFTPYFAPHFKSFRTTGSDVISSNYTSDRGNFSLHNVPSGMNYLYTVEVYREQEGDIKFGISTSDSIAIHASGHSKYSSWFSPNNRIEHIEHIPSKEWVRLDIAYYSPFDDGRIEIHGNFGDSIDAWRLPPVPSGVRAFYNSFARRNPGEFGKWSYCLAYISPPNSADIKYVDIDWRAPNLFNNWRRIVLDAPSIPGTQISGLFRVPGSHQIEVRSRAVNHWNDFGEWHTTSGLFSVASNVKPGVAPDPPAISNFNVTTGFGLFNFSVNPSSEEEWRDFILVSGMGNDNYLQSSQAFGPQPQGNSYIFSLGVPTLVSSGMLLTIGGGYQTDSTGELHMVARTDLNFIYLREPLLRTINNGEIWKAYQVAKTSSSTKFSLPGNDQLTYYFNVCGRNFNGGISPLVQSIADWKSANLDVVKSGLLWEDESSGIGRNILKNGSFEYPQYGKGFLVGGRFIGGDSSTPGAPLRSWYTTSGFGNIITASNPRSGRQHLRLGPVDPIYLSLRVGVHTALRQDINELAWNSNYFVRGYGHSEQTNAFLYKISGLIAIRTELWKVGADLEESVDYMYGTLPPGAVFLSSKTTFAAFPRISTSPPPPSLCYANNFSHKFTTTPPADIENWKPFVRLLFYNPPEIFGYQNQSGVVNDWPGILTTLIDDLSLSKLERHDHISDDDTEATHLNLEGIRLNQSVITNEGDHLHLDFSYGFGVARRMGNPKPINKAAPSSLGAYSVSGYMDYPRLIRVIPEAVSLVGSTIGHLGNSALMNGGVLVVPLGKALMFDIRPTRTFVSNILVPDEREITMNGRSISFFIPSGGSFLGIPPNQIYWDPGEHGLAQVTDIIYNTVGDGTNYRASQRPIVAKWGDIKLNNIFLDARTVMTRNSSNYLPNINSVDAYWHTAEVKIWEVSLPFVASGINTSTNSTIGYNTVGGLMTFPADPNSSFRSVALP
jgi:hypothetical protein